MSRYHLTEAYGELYNTRITEDSYYDNLRFVDQLQPEQIEEVMESLIWEFMDYGDTLEEAVDTLEYIFTDDEVICESLELISEAMSVSQRRAAQRGLRGGYSAQDAARFQTTASASGRKATQDLEAASKLAKSALSSASDSAARARRAERAASIRGALRGAKQSVKGALSKGQQYVTNKRSQLAAAGSRMATRAASGLSSAALQGQAALSRVARTARGAIGGAIRGARAGASQAWNTPSTAPSSRIPGRQQTAQSRASAKQAIGDPFANPAASAAASGLRSATTADTNRPRLGLSGLSGKPGASLDPTTFPKRTRERMGVQITSKAGKPLSGAAAAPRIRSARKQRVNASVDYDLLTQYMIEDLIYEGYATDEQEALYILEQMEPETLTEFANVYLQD